MHRMTCGSAPSLVGLSLLVFRSRAPEISRDNDDGSWRYRPMLHIDPHLQYVDLCGQVPRYDSQIIKTTIDN